MGGRLAASARVLQKTLLADGVTQLAGVRLPMSVYNDEAMVGAAVPRDRAAVIVSTAVRLTKSTAAAALSVPATPADLVPATTAASTTTTTTATMTTVSGLTQEEANTAVWRRGRVAL